jgi:hypothetical protein
MGRNFWVILRRRNGPFVAIFNVSPTAEMTPMDLMEARLSAFRVEGVSAKAGKVAAKASVRTAHNRITT